MDTSGIKSARVAKGAKVAMISRWLGLRAKKVIRQQGKKETRMPRLKDFLKDSLFSRNHVRSSFTPEKVSHCLCLCLAPCSSFYVSLDLFNFLSRSLAISLVYDRQ